MAKNKNLIFWLIISMLIWGMTWPTAKIVTGYTDEYTLLFWRFALSTIGLIPIMFYLKQPFKFSLKALKYIALGTIFVTAYNFFFFLALKHGLAGLGGVLVTTLNPIITFFLASIFAQKKPNVNQVFGLILGLIGGVFIMRLWEFDPKMLTHGGSTLFLIAAFLWSFLTFSSAGAKNYVPVLTFSFYVYLFTTCISFLVADKSAIYASLSFDWYFWANLIFLSIIATSIATTIYFKASTILGSALASSFIFLVPVMAVIGSYFMLGEVPKLTTIIGGLLCIIAVGMINKTKII